MKNYKFVLGLMLGLTFFLFMGAFTRDWIESTPTNSTVANQIDDFNRYLRVDVSDRLKSQVYGLTNGENTGNPGFKKQIFLQQGSAPGTPNADEIIFYSIDDGSNCSYYAKQEDGYIKQILKKVGSDLNFVIEAADIPADVIDSVHYAANSIDPEHLVDDFTFDTFPLSPSSAPDADYELANKKYVDDTVDDLSQICRMHQTSGQTLTRNAETVVVFHADTFDDDNISDLGNNKIIPSKAGYYQCTVGIQLTGFTVQSSNSLRLYKNATLNTSGADYAASSLSSSAIIQYWVNDIIYLNGSTDYLQVKFDNKRVAQDGTTVGSSSTCFITIARIGT